MTYAGGWRVIQTLTPGLRTDDLIGTVADPVENPNLPTMHERALLAPDEMTKRGVYLARSKSPDGYFWYYAVTSERRELPDRIEVKGAVTPQGAQRILWERLDAVDPVRRGLRLVADAEHGATEKVAAHVLIASWGGFRSRRPA